MKKIIKLASLLLAVALLVMVPDTNILTASAAPTTYSIGFNTNTGKWRWQAADTFDITKPDSDMYYLSEHIKDGDVIVVYNQNATEGLTFNVPTRVSNLTVLGSAAIILPGANGIDEFYALKNCTTAVNSDVKNAYVYDGSIVTFNKNVDNLEIIAAPATYNMITASAGTIGHAKAHYDGTTAYEIYNVAAGKFVSESGIIKTDAQFYSTTPVAASGTTTAPAATGTAASGEYDDVPKTGEPATILVLAGLSLICFAGSRKFRRA